MSAYNRAMAIVELEELKTRLPREGRLMALDVGSKTIGVATSDVLRSLATPLVTLKRSKLAIDLAALAELAAKHGAKALVVGLPLNMDGSEGASARLARGFALRMEAEVGVPVELFDERLSTFEAESRLRARGLSTREMRKVVDAEAAAVILQGWLDRRSA